MKKLKRILAAAGAILLLGLYVLSFIFALTDHPMSGKLMLASLYSTVMIPVFLYACMLVYRWTRNKSDIPKINPKTQTVDTLIFDLGKVLVDYDWKSFLKSMNYPQETIEAVGDAVFASEDWTEADRGVRSEEEILQAFIENDPEYEKEIRETFDEMGYTIHTYNYTRTWLKYLKKRGYKLYYLSNFSKPLYERCREEMSFLEMMDGGYMSWQVKMIKPEPKFYKKLMIDFHINPKRAVFLDDVLENVAEARAQGLNAIHFKGKKDALTRLKDEFDVQ